MHLNEGVKNVDMDVKRFYMDVKHQRVAQCLVYLQSRESDPSEIEERHNRSYT